MAVYEISIHQIIYALSDALDLVGVTNVHHGKRVAYLSNLIAKNLNWNAQELNQLFEASILHDCGVSRTSVHAKLTQLQWEEESDHCIVGAKLLTECSLLAGLSQTVLYHHTHWDVLKDFELPDQIKLRANCIYLADRIDVLTLTNEKARANILFGAQEIVDVIASLKEAWFCPELVDSFIAVSAKDSFWLGLGNAHESHMAQSWLTQDVSRSMSFVQLKELVQFFSNIVDAKSPFTHQHSRGVGKLAAYLGKRFGFSEKDCEQLELAGLLHDIGKLRTPDEYLEKPGRLTEEEFASIKRHSFDSQVILGGIQGLEKVALWAYQHHELLDGSGYPERLEGKDLSLGARILAIADIFQALAQERPYHPPMSPDQIIEILSDKVKKGMLDFEVVQYIRSDLPNCWKLATGLV
jgi:HD-GYP domain-containing protein (c-di-GMP phosphodiesterase class II)